MVHVDYQNRDGGILARSLKKLCATNTFVPLIHLPHLTLTLNPVAVGNSRRRHFDRNVTLTEDKTENNLRKRFSTYTVRISIKLSFGTKF
jgi:hypothetical protein